MQGECHRLKYFSNFSSHLYIFKVENISGQHNLKMSINS